MLKHWSGLAWLKIREVKTGDCESWATKFQQVTSARAFNHTLSVFRALIEIGIENGARSDNPSKRIGRASEKPKKLSLPSVDGFEKFVKEIESSGSGFSKPCANLVRFLAFGGFRITEAKNITWGDLDFEKSVIRVYGNPDDGTKNGEFRTVPMIGEFIKKHTRFADLSPVDHDLPTKKI